MGACCAQWHCAWRQFDNGNMSVPSPWTYAIETAFHEALLQARILSLHRHSAASCSMAAFRLYSTFEGVTRQPL